MTLIGPPHGTIMSQGLNMEIIALDAKNCVSVLTSALQELYLCSMEQDEVLRDALVILQMWLRWVCVLIQCLRGSFVAEVHRQSRPSVPVWPPPLLTPCGLMLTRHIGNIDSLPLLKWKERGLGFHLHSISNKLQTPFGDFARVKDSRGRILTQEPQLEATREFSSVGVKCRTRCWIKSEVIWGCPGLRGCWRCCGLEILIKPLLPWLWWRRFLSNSIFYLSLHTWVDLLLNTSWGCFTNGFSFPLKRI